MKKMKRALGVILSAMLVCTMITAVSVDAADGLAVGNGFGGISNSGSTNFVFWASSTPANMGYGRSAVDDGTGNYVNECSFVKHTGNIVTEMFFNDHGFTSAVVAGVDIKFKDVTLEPQTNERNFLLFSSRASENKFLTNSNSTTEVSAGLFTVAPNEDGTSMVIKYGENVVDTNKWYTIYALMIPKSDTTPYHVNLYVKEKDASFESAVFRGSLYNDTYDMPEDIKLQFLHEVACLEASKTHKIQYDNGFAREIVKLENDADFSKLYKSNDTFKTNFYLQPGFETASVSFGDDTYSITDNNTGFYSFEKSLSTIPSGFSTEFLINATYPDTNYGSNSVNVKKCVNVGSVENMTSIYSSASPSAASSSKYSIVWGNVNNDTHMQLVEEGRFIRISADVTISNAARAMKFQCRTTRTKTDGSTSNDYYAGYVTNKLDNKQSFTLPLKNNVTSKIEFLLDTLKDDIYIYVDGNFYAECSLTFLDSPTGGTYEIKELTGLQFEAVSLAIGETFTVTNFNAESSPYYVSGIEGGKYVAINSDASTYTLTSEHFTGKTLTARAMYVDNSAVVPATVGIDGSVTVELSSFNKLKDIKVQLLSEDVVIAEQFVAVRNSIGSAINDASIELVDGKIRATVYAVGGKVDEYAKMYLVQRSGPDMMDAVVVEEIENVATRTKFTAELPYADGKQYVVYIWDGKTLEPLKYTANY